MALLGDANKVKGQEWELHISNRNVYKTISKKQLIDLLGETNGKEIWNNREKKATTSIFTYKILS